MKTHKIGYFTLSIVSMVLAPSFAMASTSSTTANLQKAKLPDMIQNSVGMVNMDHSSMDMSGMDHSSMDMSGMDHSSMDMSGMDHSSMDMSGMDHSSMDMSGMNHSSMDMSDMDMADMDMSDMDHSSMDMSDMDHSSMDMSGMDHSSMDMSGMQGGKPPKSARSPDYSNGIDYGKFGKPMMMGDMPTWGVSVSDLGYNFDEDNINFETTAWYGTDEKRLVFESEGSAQTKDDKVIDSLSSLSYWKPLDIFWNGRLGVAYDTAMDDVAVMAGIEGTAPYFIETSANAYLYTNGQLRLNAGAEYEWRLSQHWVVIPEVEVTAFSKDDEAQHIKKGFNELETKVRLTYETLNRQVAPYLGVSYETALGANRGQHRAQGKSVDSSSVIAGLSFWF